MQPATFMSAYSPSSYSSSTTGSAYSSALAQQAAQETQMLIIGIIVGVYIIGVLLSIAAFIGVAEKKGYGSSGMVAALAIFASPFAAGLYVCALPDRAGTKNIEDAVSAGSRSAVEELQRQAALRPAEQEEAYEPVMPEQQEAPQPAQQESWGYQAPQPAQQGYEAQGYPGYHNPQPYNGYQQQGYSGYQQPGYQQPLQYR